MIYFFEMLCIIDCRMESKCRGRRPRRPANLILRRFNRRDVEDAVPYNIVHCFLIGYKYK